MNTTTVKVRFYKFDKTDALSVLSYLAHRWLGYVPEFTHVGVILDDEHVTEYTLFGVTNSRILDDEAGSYEDVEFETTPDVYSRFVSLSLFASPSSWYYLLTQLVQKKTPVNCATFVGIGLLMFPCGLPDVLYRTLVEYNRPRIWRTQDGQIIIDS